MSLGGQLGTIFGYLPFFLLGHMTTRSRLDDLLAQRTLFYTAIAFIGGALLTSLSAPLANAASLLDIPSVCFYGGLFAAAPAAAARAAIPVDLCRRWQVIAITLVLTLTLTLTTRPLPPMAGDRHHLGSNLNPNLNPNPNHPTSAADGR